MDSPSRRRKNDLVSTTVSYCGRLVIKLIVTSLIRGMDSGLALPADKQAFGPVLPSGIAPPSKKSWLPCQNPPEFTQTFSGIACSSSWTPLVGAELCAHPIPPCVYIVPDDLCSQNSYSFPQLPLVSFQIITWEKDENRLITRLVGGINSKCTG